MNAKIRFQCVVLALCTQPISLSVAQDAKFHSVDFGNGKFEQVAPKTGKLLRLKWSGKTILLRRDWDKRLNQERQGLTESENLAQDLIDRGFPEDLAKRQANQQMKILKMQFANGPVPREKGLSHYFFSIGGRGSSGSSGAGARRNLRFSTSEMSGFAVLSDNDVRFSFEENKNSERGFRFRDNGEGKIQFEFSHDHLLVRFTQKAAGSVQLAIISDDSAHSYVADSFVELQRKHPAVVKKTLLKLWRQLGIQLPLSKNDPVVLRQAIQMIRANLETSDQDAMNTIADLDSESFKKRQTASVLLNSNYENWEGTIKSMYQNGAMSAESRTRLKAVIDQFESDEVLEFVRNQKLLESPDFLIQLLEESKVNDKKLLTKFLQKTTGESFGADVSKWKAWLNR